MWSYEIYGCIAKAQKVYLDIEYKRKRGKLALFAGQYNLKEQKTFRGFMKIYNIGVPLTAIMMLVRGITQVMELSLSKAASSAISGIAGIGHILTGVGIVLLLVSLKKVEK